MKFNQLSGKKRNRAWSQIHQIVDLGVDLDNFGKEFRCVRGLVDVKGGFHLWVLSVQEEKALKYCLSFWFLLSL